MIKASIHHSAIEFFYLIRDIVVTSISHLNVIISGNKLRYYYLIQPLLFILFYYCLFIYYLYFLFLYIYFCSNFSFIFYNNSIYN